jgi:hypothetical protein
VETVFDAHVDPGLVERSLAASTFGSMWLDIPRPEYPQATGSITCDLLVVGGGYTGLWAALHAAQRNPDRRIVLIEANRIGWAASGRNGGFVDASLTHGMENGKTRWPNDIDTLEAMGKENLDGMQADIESIGLDAEWQRTGMLLVATEPHQADWLGEAAAQGQGQWLGRSDVSDEVHSCWRRMSFRACCGATGCTPSRCTTTCWPPSLLPTRSSTASDGGAGRESATAPTNFITTA